MIVNGKAVISDDIKESFFVCDLSKCKGACCVEGDLGAPLEKDELAILESVQEEVKPYLSDSGKNAIDQQGPYILDEDDEYSTPTVDGKECAYAIYAENGILKCGIEQAYLDGKIQFQKPISCHLYPIRISKYDEFEALNYDRWHICGPACELGGELKVPIYKFVRDALVRKFGQEWYHNLVALIESPDSVKDKGVDQHK